MAKDDFSKRTAIIKTVQMVYTLPFVWQCRFPHLSMDHRVVPVLEGHTHKVKTGCSRATKIEHFAWLRSSVDWPEDNFWRLLEGLSSFRKFCVDWLSLPNCRHLLSNKLGSSKVDIVPWCSTKLCCVKRGTSPILYLTMLQLSVIVSCYYYFSTVILQLWSEATTANYFLYLPNIMANFVLE